MLKTQLKRSSNKQEQQKNQYREEKQKKCKTQSSSNSLHYVSTVLTVSSETTETAFSFSTSLAVFHNSELLVICKKLKIIAVNCVDVLTRQLKKIKKYSLRWKEHGCETR